MKSIIKFISEARTELLKVTWPTRNVALTLTLTVLGVSIAFALYVSAVDYVMTQGIKWVTLRSAQTQQTGGVSATAPTGTPIDVQTTPVK